MKGRRLTVVDRRNGEIIGELSAPEEFFYTPAFQAWCQTMTRQMFGAAMNRAAECHDSLFSIVVTLHK